VPRTSADAAASLTAARGEPWLTFFHPAEFEALVRTSGFTSEEGELQAPDYMQRTDLGLRVLQTCNEPPAARSSG
jgi:hypothetical protein